jgi:hypothetical protein
MHSTIMGAVGNFGGGGAAINLQHMRLSEQALEVGEGYGLALTASRLVTSAAAS